MTTMQSTLSEFDFGTIAKIALAKIPDVEQPGMTFQVSLQIAAGFFIGLAGKNNFTPAHLFYFIAEIPLDELHLIIDKIGKGF